MHLHFLHGFLGLPRDWGPLILNLKTLFGHKQPEFHIHDLWKDLENLPDTSLKNWGLKFTQKLPPKDNILIGYSMGGRLAMHFPVWEQAKIKGMVLISANTGLENDNDKKLRLMNDQSWAEKFLKDPWEKVTSEWMAQPLFAFDRIRPPRKEADFSRALLSKALTHWSLSQQENMIERLKEFHFPIYYFHGEKDVKFSEQGTKILRQVPQARIRAIQGAGHSPHFSHPGDIVDQLKSFLTGTTHDTII